MSYDISYEENNGKIMVQCDRELYKDIMKNLNGRWNNKFQKFAVPLENKNDIDILISSVNSLQNQGEGSNDNNENDMDTPFKSTEKEEKQSDVVEKPKRKYTKKVVEQPKLVELSNTVEDRVELEQTKLAELSNTVELKTDSADRVELKTDSADRVELKTDSADRVELKTDSADRVELEPVFVNTVEKPKKKYTKKVNESKLEEPIVELQPVVVDIPDRRTDLRRFTEPESDKPFRFTPMEETFLNADVLEVNKSDIESEDDFIPIPKFQKPSGKSQVNKFETPKPSGKSQVNKFETPKPSGKSQVNKFETQRQEYKSRFETDSVDYNEYNSDDEDIYEDEEGEEELESGEETGSDDSFRNKKQYSSESESGSSDSDSDYKISKRKKKESESDSDYKISRKEKRKKKETDSDSDYKIRKKKETDSDSDYKIRKKKETDYDSHYIPKTSSQSQKHYTKEEKEKLKRKIELLELKKAKKLGKPIEDVRAERKQTSVRFTEIVKKVETLQEQVRELQLQVKKIYRR